MKQIFLAILICLISPLLPAQTAIWTGLGDGLSWEDPDNWMPDQVPQTGDSTVIENDSVVLNTNADLKNLFLDDNAILTILSNGSIKFSGALNYALQVADSKVYNEGTVLVLDVGNNDHQHQAIELRNGAAFRNDGMCQIDQTKGRGITVGSGSTFDNYRTVEIHTEYSYAIHVFSPNSKFTNYNDIGITANGNIGHGISLTSSGEFYNMGIINIQNSGSESGVDIFTGGRFFNHGDLNIYGEMPAIGFFMIGSGSSIDILDGTVNIQRNNSYGILIFGGKMTINSGATVTLSGSGSRALEVDPGAEFDCQGILDIQ